MRHVYNELVTVERAALARGPRTRAGLRGLGDGNEGTLAAIVYAGALAPIVVAGLVGWKTNNVAVGVAAGAAVGAAEYLFVLGTMGH